MRLSTDSDTEPEAARPVTVFLMDLLCIVPYYTGPLARAMKDAGVNVLLGSVPYQYDRTCFERRGVCVAPGILNLVCFLDVKPAMLRKLLKLVENLVNLAGVAIRLLVSPPDVLHVQFLYLIELYLPFELWILKLAKARDSKIVYTVHNVLPLATGTKYKHIFQRIYDLVDGLICHNQASRRRLVEEFSVTPEKIRIIPHGPLFLDSPRPSEAEARSRLGYGPDDCLVLWQGVIDEYKGVPFLLDAWRKLRETGCRATLLVAGTGVQALTDEIKRKVNALGIQDSVRLELRFLSTDELTAYFQAADILVYPYKDITTSGALMTAMTYNKAMVVSDLPPFREMLDDGKTALLVPYGDVDGLAERLCQLVMHPERRFRLSEGVRARASQHSSWANIARETNDFYDDLLLRARKNKVAEHI